jgi:hypothetical protein
MPSPRVCSQQSFIFSVQVDALCQEEVFEQEFVNAALATCACGVNSKARRWSLRPRFFAAFAWRCVLQ